MLDICESCPSDEAFDARFVAAQQNDDRESFQKNSTLRKEKELALLEKMIKATSGNTRKECVWCHTIVSAEASVALRCAAGGRTMVDKADRNEALTWRYVR